MSLDLVLTPLVTGQEIVFWICAVLAVIGAVGVIASRRPVYSALHLALVMVALAAIYASLEAEFLFAVQIIVYTGAVLMLFLFVIMLVGVSTADPLVETLRGHRGAAIVAGVGLVVLLGLATGNAITSEPVGLEAATEQGYVQSLAQLIFQRYVIPFEATAALLITAALAAMVIAHPERLRPKREQPIRLQDRLRAYADRGVPPTPLPNSGVTSQHNSIATPALLPDGSIAPGSVSTTVATRVTVATPEQLTGPVNAASAAIEGGPAAGTANPSRRPSELAATVQEGSQMEADSQAVGEPTAEDEGDKE